MKVMSDYPKEVIEKIKEIDLLTYLENYEPYELVKINERMYSTREHDSLKISNGLWCWWSRGIGGKNALKFLMVVRGMSYDDAVELLVNKTAIAPPVYSKPIKFEKAKKLILPDRAIDNSRLSRYLQWNRGIDEEIVEYCIKNDLIFEGLFTSEKSGKTFRNAIFVGYDPSGKAKYSALFKFILLKPYSYLCMNRAFLQLVLLMIDYTPTAETFFFASS